MAATSQVNGLMSPPPTEKASSAGSPARIVLAGKTGRILCVADIRGDFHELNRLIREHEATAVIHTGDFGFINAESLDRMGDKILRHLLQYSPLLPPSTRQSLLAIPTSAGRPALINALNNSSVHFPLSQFPLLLTGAITFPVPVFTVWGLIEDVRVMEKFRTGEYEVHNLSVIDEAATRVLDVGGVRLRLFGLGEGFATIAGGQGTMWTTALQIGELVDTAQRVYDSTETRLFISSAPISRNGLLSQLSAALKADLTISGGLHFRYPASFNEFSVHGDFEAYRHKLTQARETFVGVYQSVKDKVDASLTEPQLALLKKALEVAQNVPESDDGTWTNTWHWVLSDASCGHMLFSITDGRVSAETKSSGLNFSHRALSTPAPPSAPAVNSTQVTPVPRSSAPPESSIKAPPPAAAAPAPVRPAAAAPAVRPPTGLSSANAIRPPAGQIFNAHPGGNPGNGNGFRPPPGQMGMRGMSQRGAGALPNKPEAATTQPAVPAPGPATTATPSTAPAVRPNVAQPPRGPKGPFAPSANTPPAPAAGAGKLDPKSQSAAFANRAQPQATAAASAEKPKETSEAATAEKATPAEPKADAKPTPAAPAANGTLNANGSERRKRPEPRSERSNAPTPPSAAPTPSPAPPAAGAAADASASTPTPTEEKSAEAASGTATPVAPIVDARPKKHELYIRGFVPPVTEADLKGLFPGCEDSDYAYVEFKTEEAMTTALGKATKKVGEKDVQVSVSNPPGSRFGARGGRGGFRGAGGGRGGMRGMARGGRGMGGGAAAAAGGDGGAAAASKPAAAASGEGKKD
ncbi:uncharacterized protein MKK02DRAFT_34810 [Dioszegia hungarica]|uniref:DUF2433 domain-containing protein n=1 Tax=Dioszegia hungarica TaxID=4972 RepID=A0AA38H5I8_9TREE|nr:uncharacterized protein MKK02DRAFT_34810 [Dioszegia hungarica]KAI9634308.1 hypothetical protein MKK02DRAFT_34810 [Dioszegia hungarica]